MSLQVDEMLLKDFFSTYFHEDWMEEAETTAQVVQNYMQSASPAETARLRAAIIAFMNAESGSSDLEVKLLPRFGCYYLPTADGHTAIGWLGSIAELLADKK